MAQTSQNAANAQSQQRVQSQALRMELQHLRLAQMQQLARMQPPAQMQQQQQQQAKSQALYAEMQHLRRPQQQLQMAKSQALYTEMQHLQPLQMQPQAQQAKSQVLRQEMSHPLLGQQFMKSQPMRESMRQYPPSASSTPAADIWMSEKEHVGENTFGRHGFPPSTSTLFSSAIWGIGCEDYEYNILKGPREIRILCINPGLPPDELDCDLYHCELDANLAYSALSYAWGTDKTPTVTIFCNGRRLRIMPSLYSALQRIRHHAHPIYIWADAVCINQRNEIEKGHQVRLMRAIYQKARSVLIWLGPDEHNQALAVFDASRKIFAEDMSRVPHSSDSLWSGFADLFDRAWFWRLWCLQEIVLASSAELMWGPEIISWECLGFAAAWIRTMEHQTARRIPGLYNAYLMYALSISSDKHDPVSFLHLLSLTRQFKVSDARDRIYALLGLPTTDSDPENGELYVDPDYTKTLPEVYEALARKMLLSFQGLRTLSTVQHGMEVEETLPSWVPQWDRLFTYALAQGGTSLKNFAASATLPSVAPSFYGSLLVVEGLEFDAVTWVSDILPDAVDSSHPKLEYFNTIWDTVTSFIHTYPGGADFYTAFCWTITAGKDWYGMLVENEVEHLADFAACQQTYFASPLIDRGMSMDHIGDADRFVTAMTYACRFRRFFVTRKGFIGIGPPCLRRDDLVCILNGGIVPFLLRHREEHYKLVGDAYIYGIMNGEACEQPFRADLRTRSFALS